MVSKDIYLIYY